MSEREENIDTKHVDIYLGCAFSIHDETQISFDQKKNLKSPSY